jgi:hypothetical protein
VKDDSWGEAAHANHLNLVDAGWNNLWDSGAMVFYSLPANREGYQFAVQATGMIDVVTTAC